MKVTITVDCDNDAFRDRGEPSPQAAGDEVAKILYRQADRMRTLEPGDSFPLLDSNGNTVGRLEVSE
jgi:hypothetical protein